MTYQPAPVSFSQKSRTTKRRPAVQREQEEDEEPEQEQEQTKTATAKPTKVQPEKAPIKTPESVQTPPVASPVKVETVPVAVDNCTKECTERCTAKAGVTVQGLIVCLKECKCTGGKTEQMLQDVKLGNERSFGKMKWGTFIILFFVLATLSSGAMSIYKKYNMVKSYQQFRRVTGNSDTEMYQRLV